MAGRGRYKGDGLGKTGGRKKGTPNKVNGRAKDIIVQIVDNNAGKAQEMLDQIVDPKDWMWTYMKLCEFVVPKKAAVQVTTEGKESDLKSELEEMTMQEI